MNGLQWVGAAYLAFWFLICAYLWRVTGASRQLSERLAELESAAGRDKPSS